MTDWTTDEQGRITVAGLTKDVTFEPVREPALHARIDDAYRATEERRT